MNKEELAKKIGLSILDAIESTEKSNQRCAKYLKVPFKIFDDSSEPDWIRSITLEMPRYVYSFMENGEVKFKHITMAEYYAWDMAKESPAASGDKVGE